MPHLQARKSKALARVVRAQETIWRYHWPLIADYFPTNDMETLLVLTRLYCTRVSIYQTYKRVVAEIPGVLTISWRQIRPSPMTPVEHQPTYLDDIVKNNGIDVLQFSVCRRARRWWLAGLQSWWWIRAPNKPQWQISQSLMITISRRKSWRSTNYFRRN